MSRDFSSKKSGLLIALAVLFAGIFSQAMASNLYIPHNLKKKVLEEQMLPALSGSVSVPHGLEITEVLLKFSAPPDMAEMRGLGIEKLFGDDTFFSAIVPWTNLDRLGDTFPNLLSVRDPIKPLRHGITGEEVGLFKTMNFISLGFDGSGINVAVIDSGFYHYSDAVSAGILPSDCDTVNYSTLTFEDSSDGIDSAHGTACAEIIHEVAPGAKLTLIKIDNLGGLASAKQYCIDHNVRIVSHSMGWFNDGWGTGDGNVYTSVVDPLYQQNVLWCNSAGNAAHSHFQGIFKDDGSSWHQFPSGLSYAIVSNVGSGDDVQLALNWNAFASYYAGQIISDYDLYLFQDTSTNNPLASSKERQYPLPGYPPEEFIDYKSSVNGNLYYRIKRVYGTVNDEFQLLSSHRLIPWTSPHSLMSPADGPHTLTAAAVFFSNWNTNFHAEFYSSRGPNQAGLTKPDISGIDGVTSYIFGHFYGTSSACPSVAGMAALILSKQPYMSPYQLAWTLKDNADHSLMSNWPDNTNGWGKVRLELFPLRRNSDNLSSNVIIAPTRLTHSDKRLYYYRVTDNTVITLKTLLGSSIKSFGPVSGLYATGANYLDLSDLKLAAGVYIVEFTEPTGGKYARKIIISD